MPPVDQETSLRDALDSAFDKTEEAGASTAAAEAPVVEEKPVEPKSAEPSQAGAESKAVESKTAESQVSESKLEEAQTPVKSRAPGSWKPAAREKWAGIPPEIQQEVLRRERDIATGFNEVATIKKMGQELTNLYNTHQNIIQVEGGDPMTLTKNLFTTAAVLYNGSAQQKATTIAGMIKNFGVDIRMLDSMLAGQPVRQQQRGPDVMTAIRNAVQAELQPLFGQQRQAMETEVTQTIQEFATNPQNEFYEDVKDTMADILEVAAKRGIQMDLPTAYQRAIMMHSEIADVIAERQLQEKTQQANQAAGKARRRATSVRGRGTSPKDLATGEASGGSSSLGDDIRASIDALSG